MSCSLCCGTLNVSQLTIPALPTSEIERLGQDDSTSIEDSESLFDQSSEEPSSLSVLCDHDSDDKDSVTDFKDSSTISSKDLSGDEKPVVRKKTKSYSSRKKMEKDLGKKKTKFWTFKLKRRSLSSGVRTDHSPKPFLSTDFPQADDPSSLDSFGASSSASSTSSPPQVSSRRALGAGPSPSSLASELLQVVPPPILPPQAGFQGLLQAVPAPPRPPDADSLSVSLPTNPPPHPPSQPGQDESEEGAVAGRVVQRARDLELGMELGRGHHSAYPHFQYPSTSLSTSSSSTSDSLWSLSLAFQGQCSAAPPRPPPPSDPGLTTFGRGRTMDAPSGSSVMGGLPPPAPCVARTEYTQVDYIHCLVPDLHVIANCSFYWGVMDRYEAESLLETRPEGTFLLRDSAQDDFLFSVSFRRYSRSLHARIDQWNHKFSFDTHDPGVFSADTVTGLIEHYKDPNCCMFFEPMLTRPLCRNFPFSLQHLCRSLICGMSTYDNVNCLPLPKSLVEYLKYYHYKQKVRVRKLQVPL